MKTLDDDCGSSLIKPALTARLVAEGDGAWDRVQDKTAVMLSIVTSEVGAWYDMLRQKDGVIFLKEIGDGGSPIRSFLIEDPGG